MVSKSPKLKEPAATPSDVPALIWKLGPKLAPPSELIAPQTWAVLLAGELRASYQVTARLPVLWSTARAGLNWLFVPGSSLTRTRGLQVAPSSSE